jgi:hypothetical protein
VSGGHISSTPAVVNVRSGEGEKELVSVYAFTENSYNRNKNKVNNTPKTMTAHLIHNR